MTGAVADRTNCAKIWEYGYNFNCANPIRHTRAGRERGKVGGPGLPELKLINGEGKINGAENTTSPALIFARQSGNGGFPGARAERNRFSSVSHRPYVAQIVMRL